MCGARGHVCFTPESDIKCDIWECPLWANRGHSGRVLLSFRQFCLDHAPSLDQSFYFLFRRSDDPLRERCEQPRKPFVSIHRKHPMEILRVGYEQLMPRDGAIIFGDLIGKLDVLVWQKLTNSWPQTTRQT